jgi:hypothetical protein
MKYTSRPWAKYVHQSEIRDPLRLKLLHMEFERESESWFVTALRERRSIHNAIKTMAQRGKVAVVWSGRDCDCVRYSGEVRLVKATWKAIVDHIDQTYKWADGPCGYHFTTPSKAKKIERESRDLALEAFENGHPYYIYD